MVRYTKRADGRYVCNMMIGGKRHYIYGSTQKEVDRRKATLLAEYERTHLVKSSSMLFNLYCEDWFNTTQVSRNANTRDMYYYSIYKHIIPSIGHIPLNKITRSDIQAMINER